MISIHKAQPHGELSWFSTFHVRWLSHYLPIQLVLRPDAELQCGLIQVAPGADCGEAPAWGGLPADQLAPEHIRHCRVWG